MKTTETTLMKTSRVLFARFKQNLLVGLVCATAAVGCIPAPLDNPFDGGVGAIMGVVPGPFATQVSVSGLVSSVTEGDVVQLSIRPDGVVSGTTVISVGSSDSAVTIDGASTKELVFTRSNSSVAQTVQVAGAHDANAANETATLTISGTGLETVTRQIATVDDDTVNISVTGSTYAREQSASRTISVSLTHQPAADVTVNVASATPAKLGVSAGSLTFTPSNYATAQTVTLTGQVDDSDRNDESVNVNLTAAGITGQAWGVTLYDDDPAYASASSGLAQYDTRLLLDTTNSRLLIVGESQNNGRPYVYRCLLTDTSSCTEHDLATIANMSTVPGNPDGSGRQLDAFIDTTNQRLVVASWNSTYGRLNIFYCAVDLTSCSFNDTSSILTGWTIFSGENYANLSAAWDSSNGRIFIVAIENNNTPRVVRCNVNGTSCSLLTFSPALPTTMHRPRLLFNSSTNRLLFFSNVYGGSAGSPGIPWVYNCDLNLNNCTSNILGALGSVYSVSPILISGSATAFSFVHLTSDGLGLAVCDGAGQNCSFTAAANSIVTGVGSTPFGGTVKSSHLAYSSSQPFPGYYVTAAIAGGNNRPRLFYCATWSDPPTCTPYDFPSGSDNGFWPRLVLRETNHGLARAYISGTNSNNSSRPALFKRNLLQ